nr:hypothetical protein [Tanacetum cinerariifolium]
MAKWSRNFQGALERQQQDASRQRSRPKFGYPMRERDQSDARNIMCIDTRDSLLNTLTKMSAYILMKERISDTSSKPRALPISNRKDERQFFGFHNDHGHDTNSSRELKKDIEKAINHGKLDHLLQTGCASHRKPIHGTPSSPQRSSRHLSGHSFIQGQHNIPGWRKLRRHNVRTLLQQAT